MRREGEKRDEMLLSVVLLLVPVPKGIFRLAGEPRQMINDGTFEGQLQLGGDTTVGYHVSWGLRRVVAEGRPEDEEELKRREERNEEEEETTEEERERERERERTTEESRRMNEENPTGIENIQKYIPNVYLVFIDIYRDIEIYRYNASILLASLADRGPLLAEGFPRHSAPDGNTVIGAEDIP